MLYYNTLLLHKIGKIKMAGTSREISSVMTSAANNYNTTFRLDSSVCIKTRIRTEVTLNRIRTNVHNSGNYEIRDNARRTDRASASSRLRLDCASPTPWLRSPASIVPHCAPRHVIYYSLIVVFEMRKTYWSQKALLY